jgi:hypothetical protein
MILGGVGVAYTTQNHYTNAIPNLASKITPKKRRAARSQPRRFRYLNIHSTSSRTYTSAGVGTAAVRCG